MSKFEFRIGTCAMVKLTVKIQGDRNKDFG